jgi:Dolichyl-phosphate-mannose-protein mannosyltransferase
MSAMTDAGRRGFALIERLLDALTDPARRERTAAAVLLGYVAVWTLYAAIAKGSQDIHADMSEQYVLSRELAWGYSKHPPLVIAIVRAWFAVFPTADWAYYLLAMANAGLALWIAWLLSARFLDGEKRVVGLALLTLVPFFNFHALKFNANSVLLPLWAVTTLWFLRSFETRRMLDAALAGLGAAAAMYGKYWSIFLLLGLVIAALVDRRRVAYFRSPAPYVTIAVGALALAPHVAWLMTNDFAPFSYAVEVHADASVAANVRGALGYLAGSVGYAAVPLVIVFLALRPTRAALRDMAWPTTPERRLAAAAFWAGLVVPALVAPLAGVHLVSLWSMSAWTLLPVMLLSSPLVLLSRRDTMRILALVVVFPLAMVAVAPAIAFAIHRAGPDAGVAHSSVVGDPIERIWRETTDAPLLAFAGYDEVNDGISFYMRSHPYPARVLDGMGSQAVEERIRRDGLAMLCPVRTRIAVRANWCRINAISRIWCSIPGKRKEIEVSRRYLGIDGKPERYLLVTLPPWQIDKLVSLRQPVEEYAAANFDVELPPPQRKRRTPLFPMPEIQ